MSDQPLEEEQFTEDHPDDQGEPSHEDAVIEETGSEELEDEPDTSEPPVGEEPT